RRRHTRSKRDWSSDVCSSDLQYFRPSFQPKSSLRNVHSLHLLPVLDRHADPPQENPGTHQVFGSIFQISHVRAVPQQHEPHPMRIRVYHTKKSPTTDAYEPFAERFSLPVP